MGIKCMILVVFKNILCSKLQGHLEMAAWDRFKDTFLRSEIPGCVINHLWASALFGLCCSVSVFEREVKVLIILY